jgi:protein-S-isoprenylcysteine O-methyltransferase Ste14
LLHLTIGIALLAAVVAVLLVVRARDGKEVIKSNFVAQVVILCLVALLMAAVGLTWSGISELMTAQH